MFRILNLRTALVSFIFVIILSYTTFSQYPSAILTSSFSAEVIGNYELQCKLDTTQVVSGQPFSITVTCIDQITQQPVNPTVPVNITITAAAGNLGTLSGTTLGTIPTNDSKVTISNIVYTNTSGEADVQLILSASGIPDCILTTNFLAPEPSVQDSDIRLDFQTYQSKDGSTTLIQIVLSWTNGDGSKRLVVMKEADPIRNFEFPIDGYGYLASNIFGSGDAIGGAYVIFNDVGNTLTVTNLIESWIYYVRIFAYNGDAALANYNTNTSDGNPEIILDVDDETCIESGFRITNISPNPSFNDINFTLNINSISYFTIEVVDMKGCVVSKFCNKKFYDIGDYQIKIPLENLSSGSYLLKIFNGTDFAFQVFTVVR